MSKTNVNVASYPFKDPYDPHASGLPPKADDILKQRYFRQEAPVDKTTKSWPKTPDKVTIKQIPVTNQGMANPEPEKKTTPTLDKDSLMNKSKRNTIQTPISENIDSPDERDTNGLQPDADLEKSYALPPSNKSKLAEIPKRDLKDSTYPTQKPMSYSTPGKVDPRSKNKEPSPEEIQNVIIEENIEENEEIKKNEGQSQASPKNQDGQYYARAGVVKLDDSIPKEIHRSSHPPIKPEESDELTEQPKQGFFGTIAKVMQEADDAVNFAQALQKGSTYNTYSKYPQKQPHGIHTLQGEEGHDQPSTYNTHSKYPQKQPYGIHNNSNWPNNLTSQTYNKDLQNPSFGGIYRKISLVTSELINPEYTKKAEMTYTEEDEQVHRNYAPINTEPDHDKKPLKIETPKSNSPKKGGILGILGRLCGSPKKGKNSPTKRQTYEAPIIQPTKIEASPTKKKTASNFV